MNQRTTIDRRSGTERRRSGRNKVIIDIVWEASSGPLAGTLSDISEFGCFILSGSDIEEGEKVRIFLPLKGGTEVEFAGRVANQAFEIGFACNFVDLTSAQREFLTRFAGIHRAA